MDCKSHRFIPKNPEQYRRRLSHFAKLNDRLRCHEKREDHTDMSGLGGER